MKSDENTPDIFGIPIKATKCRLCQNQATNFKIGSLEIVENKKVVSIRMYFLCDEHKDVEEFERMIPGNAIVMANEIYKDIADGKIKPN